MRGCGEPGDDQPCVAEVLCEPATGACDKYLYRDPGASCDTDGDLCTLETCDADAVCQSGDQFESCDTEKLTEPCQVWVCQPETGNCKATGFAGEISCSEGVSIFGQVAAFTSSHCLPYSAASCTC